MQSVISTNKAFSTRLLSGAALAALAVAMSGASARAAVTLFDSNGFESPYTLGGLSGQTGGGPEFWVDVSQGTSALSAGNVVNTIVQSGSQSVQVTRTGLVNKRYFYTTNNPPPADIDLITPANRFVQVSWNQYTPPASGVFNGAPGNPFNGTGAFFGIESYGNTGVPVNPSHRLQGSLGVDSGTGEVLYWDKVFGGYQAGPVLAFNTWHSFSMIMDYTDREYDVYVNNTLLVANLPWYDDTTPYAYWGDADLTTTDTAPGENGVQQGSAYFDNLKVITFIPEPTTLVVLAGGAVSVLARRRSH
jgi:hypothetical protein